jgi:pimeloyl-ACP methyl ester carboxylesterase
MSLYSRIKKDTLRLISLRRYNYLLSLQDLTAKFNIPEILYDQLGCGNSAHLKEKNGDESFWTVKLFIVELNNLIKHLGLSSYDVFGNSWGGMLAAEFGLTQPKGLNKLIIADPPASMLWLGGSHCDLEEPTTQEYSRDPRPLRKRARLRFSRV